MADRHEIQMIPSSSSSPNQGPSDTVPNQEPVVDHQVGTHQEISNDGVALTQTNNLFTSLVYYFNCLFFSDTVPNQEPVVDHEVGTHQETSNDQVALTQTNNLRTVPQGSTSEGRTVGNVTGQDGSGRINLVLTMNTINGEVRIDMPGDGGAVVVVRDGGAVVAVRMRTRNKSMIKIIVAVLGQAVAGIIANNVSIGRSFTASTHSWPIYVLVFSILFALICTLASIYLSGTTTREALSVWMFKIGAMATALVTTLSLGLELPPMVALIACPVAFVMAAALVFASS